MKRVEEMIIAALEAAKDLADTNKQIIASEYNGYIANFGATMKQCGLPTTVLMYSRANEEGPSKKKVVNAIFKIVKKNSLIPISESSLLDYYINNYPGHPYVNERVEYAAIALKLAIRTFKSDK